MDWDVGRCLSVGVAAPQPNMVISNCKDYGFNKNGAAGLHFQFIYSSNPINAE
jgi:hypothetical protein